MALLLLLLALDCNCDVALCSVVAVVVEDGGCATEEETVMLVDMSLPILLPLVRGLLDGVIVAVAVVVMEDSVECPVPWVEYKGEWC